MAAATLVAFLCATPVAEADGPEMPSIRHRVQAGDSLALLAAEYYGDRRHAVFILVANRMTHPRALKPGEVLKVPMNRRVTAKAGDTVESLAKQYLGDERRGKFIAEFNNLVPPASVAAGQPIAIPFHVKHTAASKEKISDIAAAYFGDRSKAKLLRTYNFRKGDVLAAGSTIIVPINHVRVQSSKLPPPDPDSTARVAKRGEMQKRTRELLPEVRRAWREGDYSAVKRALAPLETEYLDATLAADVGALLGAAYVAFGDADSALATFRKVLERNEGHQLSAYDYSPKVRAVWERAGGTIAQ